MRKHFYLITEHDDTERVSQVEITDTRLDTAEKNTETAIQTINKQTGFATKGTRVGMGYADFVDEDEYKNEVGDVIHQKLVEIDAMHLEKAGLDVDKFTEEIHA